MQTPAPADVITWRLLVVALFTALGFLCKQIYSAFMTRIGRMERKINGLISHAIKHAESNEQQDLLDLLKEDQDGVTISR